MQLSIVIISFNTQEMLKNCLLSIQDNTNLTTQINNADKGLTHFSCDYEVFVVDNNSKDESANMVKALFPWVNLIKNSQNL